MKKFLFMALCGGALLAACSNDEKVDEPTNTSQIAFTTFVNKASKGETTKDNLNKIVVSAYSVQQSGPNAGTSVLYNQVVNRSTAAPYTWTYTPVAYWMTSTDYKFSAINLDGFSVQPGANTFGAFEFSQNTGKGELDVVWATNTRNTPAAITAEPDKVPFSFNHALCRVKYTFQFSDPNHTYSIGVKGITLAGTSNAGTYTLGETHLTNKVLGTWAYPTTFASYTADYGIDGQTVTELVSEFTDNAYTSASTDYRYLVPGEYTGAADKMEKLIPGFTITLYQKNGDMPTKQVQGVFVHGASAKKIEATFLQGHSYNITATITYTNIVPPDDDDTTEDKLFAIQFDVTDVTGYGNDEDVTW